MTKRIRYGLAAAALVAVALAGCAAPAQKVAGQTGTPISTTTTEATTTTTTVVESVLTTTTVPGIGGPKAADGQAPAARTVTITNATFNPPTLAIAVGDTVTFKGGDNVAYDVVVGDLPSATVTGGLVQTFQFTQAGSLTITTEQGTATLELTVGDGGPTAPTTTGGDTTATAPATTSTVPVDETTVPDQTTTTP